MHRSRTNAPTLSIVVPVFNEEDNVVPLAREIVDAIASPLTYEIVFVDDGSTDATTARIRRLRQEMQNVVLVRHVRRCGQSAAIRTGARDARARWVATLDGDGQNEPADMPLMLELMPQDSTGLVTLAAGGRRLRRDSRLRRL